MRRGENWVKAGATIAAAAVAGWLITMAALSFAAKPAQTEDLTAAWRASGATPLGAEATVNVLPDRTLVAFIVGTDLLGVAGTTAGSCTASTQGPIALDWPVHIDTALTGVLRDDQQIVAVAGWKNTTADPVTVRIRCTSADSGVEHFVAVPTTTGRLESRPWFQPWGWLGLGVLGAATAAAGALRS